MVQRLLKFKIYKKRFIIYFIIIFSLFNMWYLDISNIHYITFENVVLSSEQKSDLKKDYKLYLKKEINALSDSKENNIQQDNQFIFLNYLLKNNLKPLNIGLDFNHIGEINGVTAVYKSTKEIIPLITPIITLLLILNSFKNDEKSYKYIMTLPVRKESIYRVKFFSSILVSFGSILLILFIDFIKGSLLGGMGSLRYPVLLNTSHLNTELCTNYLPIGLFLIISLCIVLAQIVIYSSVGIIIINFFRNLWIRYFFAIAISMMPIIYAFTMNIPLSINVPINLIPFLNDTSFYLITYGLSIFQLLGYILIMLFIVGKSYKIGIKSFKELEI